MNQLILIFVIAIGGFFTFQKAYSCEDAFLDLKHIGKVDQNPSSVAKIIFQRIYTSIKNNVTPDINIAELEILPETTSLVYNRYNRHKDNQFYKIAVWRGEKVFLKKIKDSDGEYELAILRTLNKIGIPTLLMGVVKDKDGILYMVNTFQDSVVFRNLEDVSSDLDKQYHESVRQQLDRINFLFSANNIFPGDFQFLVSKDGKVHIIDVEYYIIN